MYCTCTDTVDIYLADRSCAADMDLIVLKQVVDFLLTTGMSDGLCSSTETMVACILTSDVH